MVVAPRGSILILVGLKLVPTHPLSLSTTTMMMPGLA